MVTIVCGADSSCTSIRCRDYKSLEKAVDLIMHTVEVGFDTRSNEAYELFASEGMNGNPDELDHDTYLEFRESILNLAIDAIYYLNER